ncbi:uroporphyrinogen-III synthase [Alteraurantiacibacter aestuarii]|uniref:Uroporphyrinogen-III synthase n=1 Tax=Alteraurantiacibacter aestuarii TaxID=650004 RepID=A0A844ZK94_9SPHN|nr:uroporphyrinogen-III synthase [Alteraurantiacibacter aestuarii]MXO87984.1 uroporphyrinogen-III synthase [Alteraurantiacibacter aestuarii]
MSTAILSIRPQPGAQATCQTGAEMGLEITPYPLSRIEPLAWEAPDPATIDALLIGSANAIRHGGESLRALRGKPVFAVGRSTAAVAKSAGFTVQLAGQGGLQELLSRIPAGRVRLLRIAGRDHVPLQLPEQVSMETRIAYAAQDVAMPDPMQAQLAEGALVLLHSAGSARHLRAECERLNLDLGAIAIAALGPRIADAAGEGWARIGTAPQPTDQALLALAADMCH